MEQPTTTPKRIPYGMQNFEDVILDNCYYVDKTRFIPEIEASNRYFFFIRPRRFGKSLLMSMLRHYYDVNMADKFERIFGKLWIGQHPTPEHNKYLVLHLNFAGFAGVLEGYKERMDGYCRITFRSFLREYAEFFPADVEKRMLEEEGAANQLAFLADICYKAGQQIYLFIDEYDHFTNEVLSVKDIEAEYKAVTHGTGAFRAFFDAIKGGADLSIKRIFITGVSPVTMDDLTSGFNIGTNYTADPQFNQMLGFTEDEVRVMLDYYRQHYQFKHTTDELIEAMRPWYDNYCFSEKSINEPTLYNTNMVLYFLFRYRDAKGEFPTRMVDDNIRTAYGKLRMLMRKDKEFAHDASTIQEIAEKGGIAAELKPSFPAETIVDSDNFVSLLYYFGMLTIAGRSRGKTLFRIPNQTVREQMYNYLIENYRDNHLETEYSKRNSVEEALVYDGVWKPYFEYIADCLKRFASQRDKQKGEAFVHGFTLAQTCLISGYLPVSELDAGPDGGYADIYLQPLLNIYPEIEHSYLLELKYLRQQATDAQVQAARQQAIDQLRRHEEKSEVISRTHQPTQLHRLILLWRGMELAVAEEL